MSLRPWETRAFEAAGVERPALAPTRNANAFRHAMGARRLRVWSRMHRHAAADERGAGGRMQRRRRSHRLSLGRQPHRLAWPPHVPRTLAGLSAGRAQFSINLLGRGAAHFRGAPTTASADHSGCMTPPFRQRAMDPRCRPGALCLCRCATRPSIGLVEEVIRRQLPRIVSRDVVSIKEGPATQHGSGARRGGLRAHRLGLRPSVANGLSSDETSVSLRLFGGQ